MDYLRKGTVRSVMSILGYSDFYKLLESCKYLWEYKEYFKQWKSFIVPNKEESIWALKQTVKSHSKLN